MIYVTGDMHGDPARYKQKGVRRLKKGDTLVVCGDFGFVWDGSKKEGKALEKIASLPFQTVFVEGTHDNYDLLTQYPLEEFACATARRLGQNLWHLLRGEVYTIEGRRLFTFGGGESTDLDSRVPGVSWWPGEQATVAEIDAARQKLADYGGEVDYIVTHECSAALLAFLGLDERVSPMNVFFNEVERGCQYRNWFFGCYHLDRRVAGRHTAVFQNILPLEG